ncbi:Phosphoribosylaminoimidazole-succinocarboxamide synthase [Streptomyces violarus]
MSGFVEKPEPIQVPGLVHLHTGKVRELYQNEAGDLVMVASDRISAFDWVLPTEIPTRAGSSRSSPCGGSTSWRTWSPITS